MSILALQLVMGYMVGLVTALALLLIAGHALAPGGIDSGHTAWLLISMALVQLMLPGLAFFYAGLLRPK